MVEPLNLKQKPLNQVLQSDAYILVTGDITATNGDENNNATFKNCAPFIRYVTHINDEDIDTAENLDITMSMNKVTIIETLHFTRDKSAKIDAGNPNNFSTANSSSFKYKYGILEKPANNGVLRKAKIAVSLKLLSNFWRSLELSFINYKIHLELTWTKNCVMSNVACDTTLK